MHECEVKINSCWCSLVLKVWRWNCWSKWQSKWSRMWSFAKWLGELFFSVFKWLGLPREYNRFLKCNDVLWCNEPCEKIIGLYIFRYMNVMCDVNLFSFVTFAHVFKTHLAFFIAYTVYMLYLFVHVCM